MFVWFCDSIPTPDKSKTKGNIVIKIEINGAEFAYVGAGVWMGTGYLTQTAVIDEFGDMQTVDPASWAEFVIGGYYDFY